MTSTGADVGSALSKGGILSCVGTCVCVMALYTMAVY